MHHVSKAVVYFICKSLKNRYFISVNTKFYHTTKEVLDYYIENLLIKT
ncbi:hypothetical protein [Moraxella lacunata]